MCPCGGELTVWCIDCGDWVCDDCGCDADHDAELRPEDWDDEYDPADDYLPVITLAPLASYL
jgi:hypothetical protein